MRILNFKSLLLLCLTLAVFTTAAAQEVSDAAAKALPAQVGEWRAAGPARQIGYGIFEAVRAEDFGVVSHASRPYASADGASNFNVHLVQTRTTSSAYSLLTHVAKSSYLPAYSELKVGEVGAASVSGPGGMIFVKGPALVEIRATGRSATDDSSLKDFARHFAARLDVADTDIPILVLHLPEWEKKLKEGHHYAVTLPTLQQDAGNRPALDALSFEGGAEAVTAMYADARLVVVEFTTPQHAFDADAAVRQRIEELRAAGQPVPAYYRREGNYAVFVFDAPDAAAAEQLAAGVKYEKDVRWLGRNPRAAERALREYSSVMGGTILSVIILTGLAITTCLAIGGVVGGIIFMRRRARNAEHEVYTDAGGMLRLNLEDLNTPPTARLLGQGKE